MTPRGATPRNIDNAPAWQRAQEAAAQQAAQHAASSSSSSSSSSSFAYGFGQSVPQVWAQQQQQQPPPQAAQPQPQQQAWFDGSGGQPTQQARSRWGPGQ